LPRSFGLIHFFDESHSRMSDEGQQGRNAPRSSLPPGEPRSPSRQDAGGAAPQAGGAVSPTQTGLRGLDPAGEEVLLDTGLMRVSVSQNPVTLPPSAIVARGGPPPPPPPQPNGLPPGTVIGQYLLERMVGRGGMAEVYLATHQALGMKVAVKRLRPNVARDPSLVDRFFEEARRHSRIRHPNIVAITDFVSEGDNHVFVMEYLEGEPLDQRLDRATQVMPVDICLHVGIQLCQALEAVHAANVVHRDLKPSNVFLTNDEPPTVKLLDFGIAKFVDQDGRSVNQTADGLVVGTPGYMAPEQVLAGKVTARSDIYNVGLILFEMLAGRPPFAGEEVTDLMRQHAVERPPLVSSMSPSPIPPRLDRLLASCLAKKPEERPLSATELRRELEAIRAGEPDAAPAEIEIAPVRRSGGRALWLALLLVVGAGGASWVYRAQLGEMVAQLTDPGGAANDALRQLPTGAAEAAQPSADAPAAAPPEGTAAGAPAPDSAAAANGEAEAATSPKPAAKASAADGEDTPARRHKTAKKRRPRKKTESDTERNESVFDLYE